ncbi:hypothetical protein KY285_010657 [Solanum tuberosum]|nr:hypothetical protein KY289_011209 [Solanum tuberosum]KAH0734950.1 hypothetical protein KY285_010657 [Solanum tuberosum]
MTCFKCHQVGHNRKACQTMVVMGQPGGYTSSQPSSSHPPVFSQPSSSSKPPLFIQPSRSSYPPVFIQPSISSQPPLFSQPSSYPPVFIQPSISSQPPLFSQPSSSNQQPMFSHQDNYMCFDSSTVRKEQQPAKSRGTNRGTHRGTGRRTCKGTCRGTARGIGRGTDRGTSRSKGRGPGGVSSQQPDQPRAMGDSTLTGRQKRTETIGFGIYTNSSGHSFTIVTYESVKEKQM